MILNRNGSFLANLFLGQFLTRVICPDCNYESVTCEPFNSIPLDLEKDAYIIRNIDIFPWNNRHGSINL